MKLSAGGVVVFTAPAMVVAREVAGLRGGMAGDRRAGRRTYGLQREPWSSMAVAMVARALLLQQSSVNDVGAR